MSIHLHLSCHADHLLAALRPMLAEARKHSLQSGSHIPRPIPVLVPSAQLADWLQIRLARDFGLSMGFSFLQPAAYLSQHIANTPFAESLASSYAHWAPDSLRWHMLPQVEAFAEKLGHDRTKPLLPRDRFAFAQLLAGQLDRYARFRPDWPHAWSSPTPAGASADERWQRDLWRVLMDQPDFPPHPAQLLAQLAATGTGTFADSAESIDSRQPLFVVGGDLLDPLLLRTLQVLSRQSHESYLYLLLPSLGYLGDQSRHQQLKTLLTDTLDPEEPLELGGHPLLSSLGQQAVGHFLLLDQLSPDYADWPEVTDTFAPAPPGANLLQRLQADIRAQRTPPGPPATPDSPDLRPTLDVNDISLRIHCCHSPRRELEVLRDELLRAFNDLPDLLPEQVLIAVSDFDLYAPLAEAILRSGPHPLPVRLTAIPTREANPVAVALLALLQLAVGRHSASELIELLNLSAIQHHLGLEGDPDALGHLADMIRTSGITHDIDTRARDHLDATGTWRAALDRVLAGAWFGPAEGVFDAAGDFVHPLAPDLHHADEVRLRFIAWLTRLAHSQHVWRTEHSAARWAEHLATAVDGLLTAEKIDDHAAAVHRIINELALVSTDTPLDAGALIDWLQPVLENATSLRTSMGGEILFGRLNQLHGLPSRVFAFLGLQDGTFPRASRRPAWDLLSKTPERWDADPRRQDRQWFLDTLLTPTDRLILTAANRSLRTAHDGPLSACLEEVVRAATNTVRPSTEAKTVAASLVIKHPIQPFSVDYFSANTSRLQSHDAAAARIASRLYRTGEAPPVRPFLSPQPSVALAPAAVAPLGVTLDQLASFWQDPARAWLKALRVNVPQDEADDAELDDAPLTLNGLQAYGANAAALEVHLHPPGSPLHASAREVSSRLIANRALPPGALGALAWHVHEEYVAPLVDTLTPLHRLTELTRISIQLDPQAEINGDVRLGAASADLPTDWVLLYRPGKYEKNPKYQIAAFLQTAATAWQLDRPVACVIGSLDDKSVQRTLPPIAPAEARCHLQALIDGYRVGQTTPLCYAPNTSAQLANALVKANDDETTALLKAGAEWEKPGFNSPDGEGLMPAAQLAWRDTHPFAPPHDAAWLTWARRVAAPLHAWWNQ